MSVPEPSPPSVLVAQTTLAASLSIGLYPVGRGCITVETLEGTAGVGMWPPNELS